MMNSLTLSAKLIMNPIISTHLNTINMGITVSTGNPVSPKELEMINQRYIERRRVATDLTMAYQAYQQCRGEHPLFHHFYCWPYKHQMKFLHFEWNRLNEDHKLMIKSNHLYVRPTEPK